MKLQCNQRLTTCICICMAMLNVYLNNVKASDGDDRSKAQTKTLRPLVLNMPTTETSLMLLYQYRIGEYIVFQDDHKRLGLIKDLRHMRGDCIQILRLIAWLNEPKAMIRKELLNQWLGLWLYDNMLPARDVLNEKFKGLLKFEARSELKIKLDEVDEVYRGLRKDSLSYNDTDTAYATGILIYKQFKMFIDKHCFMGCSLFDPDIRTLILKYKEHLRTRGEPWVGEDNQVYIPFQNRNVIDVYMENLTGNTRQLRNEISQLSRGENTLRALD